MTAYFDVVLVGQGPTSLGSLLVLRDSNARILVLDGCDGQRSSNLHPKIDSVAYERGQRGVACHLVNGGGNNNRLFSIAETGGLGNYWGQQVHRYEGSDVATIFGADVSEDLYQRLCNEIESRLAISGGQLRSTVKIGSHVVELRDPRLVRGSSSTGADDLNGIRNAIVRARGEIQDVTIAALRAVKLEKLENDSLGIRIHLSNGESIRAQKVILAAGLVGTASLVLRSIQSIDRWSFSDHCPQMMLTVGLGHLFGNEIRKTSGHFNSIECTERSNGEVKSFASIYDTRAAPMSLLLSYAKMKPGFRGRHARLAPSAFRAVQMWDRSTVANLEFYRDRGTNSNDSATWRQFQAKTDPENDDMSPSLRETVAEFKGCLRAVTTSAGQGFHHHNLRFGNESVSVDDVLLENFGENVFAVDASVHSSIAVGPPTLSSMVFSLVRTRERLA